MRSCVINCMQRLSSATPIRLLHEWMPWGVALYVALWPFPSLANAVLCLCGGLFVIQLLLTRSDGAWMLLDKPAWALSAVLFLGYWLPEVLSIQPPHALQIARKALFDLRYLPFMWVAAIAVNRSDQRQTTLTLVGVIVAIWTVDGLLQWQAPMSPLFSILNRAMQSVSGQWLCAPDRVASADRLSGLWGPCHLKFGLVLVSVSPFLIVLAANYRRWLGIVAALAVLVVLLLAGSRASWLSYGLILISFVWRRIRLSQLITSVCVVGGLAAIVFLTSWYARERIARTALFMGGDTVHYDQALSGRLRIWKVATCVIETHPLRGGGVRQFRHLYAQCDAASDRPVWGEGAAFHPHQLLLEILTETGLVGFLCWLLAIAMAWQAWRSASHSARHLARPALIALGAILFPINSHLAVYSSFWGGVTVFLAGLYVGMLFQRPTLCGGDLDLDQTSHTHNRAGGGYAPLVTG